MHEVLIVGGGPAGLNAALTLGRARRRVLLVDSGSPRNRQAAAVHNFLSRDGLPVPALRARARDELARYATVEVRDGSVVSVEGAPGAFIARLADGRKERAARVVLCTGIVDQLPPVEGLAELWGSSVLHCPYCHGWEVRDEALSMLVLTDLDLYFAASLSRWSTDLVVFAPPELSLAAGTLDFLGALGVDVRRQAVTAVAAVGDGLEVHIDGAEPLFRRALFVHPEVAQRSDLPRQLGCKAFDDGFVEVDDVGQTSVPGVFAAGDMARRATQQFPATFAINAAAQGLSTAVFCDQELFFADPFA